MQPVTLDPKTLQQILNQQPQAPAVPPKKQHKIWAYLSVFATCLSVLLLWIGAIVADQGEIYPSGGVVAVILVAPTGFILVSNIILTISVKKTHTNYGLTVTPLVFSVLTMLGAFGNAIAFAFIAGFSGSDYGYSNDPYYYTYVCPSCRRPNYELQTAGYSMVCIASFILFFSQLIVVVISSLEIRRVVKKSSTQPVIIVQQAPSTTMQQQPVQYSMQPQVFNNNNNNQPVQYYIQGPQGQPILVQGVMNNNNPQPVQIISNNQVSPMGYGQPPTTQQVYYVPQPVDTNTTITTTNTNINTTTPNDNNNNTTSNPFDDNTHKQV